MGTLDYKLTIRNADDTADLLTITTLAAGPNPYITATPRGDGQSIDPVSGKPAIGAYVVRVVDEQRVVTSVLADDEGQQQQPGRVATLSSSEDRGTSWDVLVSGFVNLLRQSRGNAFEFTIGETSRIEQTTKVFTQRTDTFNAMSCLIGGPVRGGFGPIIDHGGWRMKIASQTPVNDGSLSIVTVDFVSGWMPRGIAEPFGGPTIALGGYEFVQGAITAYASSRIEAMAAPFMVDGVDPGTGAALLPGHGLEARMQALDGSLIELFQPLPALSNDRPLFTGNSLRLLGTTLDPALIGTTVELYVYPTAIGPDSPLHVSGHPADLVQQLWTELGIPVDTDAWTATRNAIGPDLGIALRFADPAGMLLSDFQTLLFGLFGFSYRVGATGAREMVATRVRDAAPPALVLTQDDLRDAGDTPWQVDEGTIITQLVVNTQSFAAWRPVDSQDHATRPIDELTITPRSVVFDNPHPTGVGAKVVQYDLPGDIYHRVTGPLWSSTFGSNQEIDLVGFVSAMGSELFDRTGTGLPSGTLPFLRGVDAQVGDLVILDIAHLPNGNVRGGQRIVQITKRTETPGGPDLTYADAGSTAQANGITPTFTATKDTATDPRRYVRVALTNAAALSAAGLALRIEWGFGATQPDTGTLLARLSPDALATVTSIRSARVQAHATVWVRVRTEQQGQVPGPYTTWQEVALDPIAPPTGLTSAAVVNDPTARDLTWTPGAADLPVTVRVGLTSDPATQRVQVLPAESATYRLTGLTPGAMYTVEVLEIEEAPYLGASAAAMLTFTADVGSIVLAPPTDPVPFAGVRLQLGLSLSGQGLKIDGSYGIEVTPTDQLGTLAIEVAVETAAGSGTPGAFSEVDVIAPAPVLGRTRWTGTAPNDGKRRYLRARTRRDGAVDSGYCATVSVLPWGSAAPPENTKLAAPAFAVTPTARATDAGVQLWGRITFTKPTSPYYARTRFTITPPAAAAFTLEAVDASTPLEFAMGWGASYQVTAAAVTTSGVMGDASAPQTALFGLFANPGVPQGVGVYDPAAFDPATGAPRVGTVPLGDPSDDTGLTLHTDITDAGGRNVSTVQAKADAALDSGGNLNPGVTQSDGVAQRVLAKGHVQGQAKDTDTIVFDQPFQDPPLILLRGGVAFDSALTGRWYDDTAPKDVTAAHFTLQARFRKKGTLTQQSDPFPGGTLTLAGQEKDVTLSNAPSADGTYLVSYAVQFDSPIGESDSCVIHVDTDQLGTGDWVTRASRTYSKDSSLDTQHFDEELAIAVSGLSGLQSRVRVQVASLSAQTVSALTVTPGSVDYSTGGSDVFSTRTPDAEDRLTWDAIETS